MAYERNHIHQSDAFQRNVGNTEKGIKNIYYGEVESIEDDTDGGRIKVRIRELDSKATKINLPWCYPIEPKYFHVYPQVGEMVRVFIEDLMYPQRSRFWMGPIISQLQNISFDRSYTSLATTNINFTKPLAAISTFPDAKGVFPTKEDIGLIGKNNTDVILRVRDVEIRAGKHLIRDDENDEYKLNKTNPASIRATFDLSGETTISSSIIMGDKIALIAHDGIPKFKAAEVDREERNNIFNQAHPLGRGDVIVDALELLRKAIVQHIHGYPGLPADKSGILIDLEKVDFNNLLQKNILIN